MRRPMPDSGAIADHFAHRAQGRRVDGRRDSFDVKLTECPQALNGQQVGLFFESGGTVDYTSGNLFAYRADSQGVEQVPQTKADNVQANLDGSAIHLGRNKGAQAAQTFLVSQTAGSSTYGATLRYLACYIRSGAGSIVAGISAVRWGSP